MWKRIGGRSHQFPKFPSTSFLSTRTQMRAKCSFSLTTILASYLSLYSIKFITYEYLDSVLKQKSCLKFLTRNFWGVWRMITPTAPDSFSMRKCSNIFFSGVRLSSSKTKMESVTYSGIWRKREKLSAAKLTVPLKSIVTVPRKSSKWQCFRPDSTLVVLCNYSFDPFPQFP